jgi:ATP:ADP antiporter, AAA family
MKGSSRSVATAMACAAVVTAQLVSGKATRDALFLASLDFTALPTMLVAASVVSILLVGLTSRGNRWMRPALLVPASSILSGVLFLGEWLLTSRAPSRAAILVYFHVSAAGPLLLSGFWLVATERFDPRTARKRVGHIAGAGTVGGLVSALLAERVAVTMGAEAMLPFLAAFNFASAWLVWRLAVGSEPMVKPALIPRARLVSPARTGFQVLAESAYLRNLAALVLLGTTSAALVDYLFKAQAVATFGRGGNLLRFFAIYYAATSLITFAVQVSSTRFALNRFGLALTTSTPSLALIAGSVGTLFAPGLGGVVVARGGEAIFRGSLFRAGYETLYTPIPAADKRAAKSIIDVAFDRMGDAVGGGLVRVMLLAAPAMQSPLILSVGMACSAIAMVVASRLNHGYIDTLGNSLMTRGSEIDLTGVDDSTTPTVMLDALKARAKARTAAAGHRAAAASGQRPAVAFDSDVRDIIALRSRDRDRITEVLTREEGLTFGVVAHAIPLLAWDPVADHAVYALRKVAEERVGQLVDALLDPNQDFAVRRRLVRVFSVCVSQRAADGLLLGLEDSRFDVRRQSARSLASILEKNPRIYIDRERIFAVVQREVAVGKPVWESRRLLEGLDGQDNQSPLDEFVRDRAGESLAHVFTLLSLVLQREPLQIAFRSLHTDDVQLQGTALEYLGGVLPAPIRQRLWPFLEVRPVARPARSRDEVIADLLRSNVSIMLNLHELQERSTLVSAELTAV